MSFAEELVKAIDEGLEVKFRKGFFKQSIVMQVSDYSNEFARHVSRELDSRCDEETLIGNLKHAKIQLFRKS